MKQLFTIVVLLSVYCSYSYSQNTEGVEILKAAYPDHVKDYDGKYLILKNGSKLLYDDGIEKSGEQLLNEPSIADMLRQPYRRGTYIPQRGEDSGRIRNESFMKAMYGATSKAVQDSLVTIVWCGNKIKVTKINNVHIQLQRVGEELNKYPELKKYLKRATTFNWRIIRGTNRLSTHSFGTAIDLNVEYSNYWQWTCRCTKEDAALKYQNKIPQQIVDIFEKYGFIWGGKWYHYDTMHFEYRPELLQ